ncbi:MAG TPA: hypothetical protein V6D14_08600 [Coleofasciculaceae cyanobacterium]|jgi:hypothetical protein
MNNIQIKGVDSTLSQVVLKDIHYLKQHLDDILISSDQTLIENLIEETEFSLSQAKDDSKTYEERYIAFTKLTESWFDVHQHYKDTPEAIELIRAIDHLTNYSIAYSYLFLSLSLINEGKIGEYRSDLERIVSGFLLLSEIVDMFADFFSISELKQIYDGAKNAISVYARDVTEYFENGFELSNLVTQLRAYSSLIVLKVEEHIKKAESTLKAEATQLKNKVEIDLSSRPWWEQIAGTFTDNSVYDEAMRLGREYRDSLHSGSTEPSDV